MEKLAINLVNCYGINKLNETFDFSGMANKAYAIYAPNGLMKTSFTRTFLALSKEEEPKEERFGRPSTFDVDFGGVPLEPQNIYVLQSEIDTSSDDTSVTNLLINQDSKSKYDALVKGLEKAKSAVLNKLQKASGKKKLEVEGTIINDFQCSGFIEALLESKRSEAKVNSENIIYAQIFDPKALEVLDSPEFVLKAREFHERYDEVFENSGGLYLKGVFNPTKAASSCASLEKNAFFKAGHKIKISGDAEEIGLAEFKEKINGINKQIDSDKQLSKLKSKLSKNAQTLALQSLLESTSASDVESLLTNLNPGKREWFKKELWRAYIQNCPEVENFLTIWEDNRAEIKILEDQAATEAPQWLEAINLFNSRFIDMPFKLGLFNQAEVVLGKSKAQLKFIFEDGEDIRECKRAEITSLSQGEKRALYLLNFIFDVEVLKKSDSKTFFIIDDVADSFDYKNKHAILQYLHDLTAHENFYQIILTHNFDFYRSLAQFVNRKGCLMATQANDQITLEKAEGVNNIFVKLWQKKLTTSQSILYSCVPFTRNIIEYTRGEAHEDYEKLTELLHWKEGTSEITEGQFYGIYNAVFGTDHDTNSNVKMIDILFVTADQVSKQDSFVGLNLQDKVLLSIAIRIKAERYITNRLREIEGASYWSTRKAYGRLLGEFEQHFASDAALFLLKQVSVTVCSNIHLNSFMYEPILDLSIEHLTHLYDGISALS